MVAINRGYLELVAVLTNVSKAFGETITTDDIIRSMSDTVKILEARKKEPKNDDV